MRDSDTKKRPPHTPALCQKQNRTRYITGGGRGAGHSDIFKCPSCGRTGRYALNYLSGRNIVCNGLKFAKVPHPTRNWTTAEVLAVWEEAFRVKKAGA